MSSSRRAGAAPGSEPARDESSSAFLFTNIEASTRRWEEHPDAMAVDLARHDELLRRAVESMGGEVFFHTGDGMGAVFPTAVSAIGAAVAGQIALTEVTWRSQTPLRVRMAVHNGPAHRRAGSFFGETLNRTARLTAVGAGGQVLCSRAAAELIMSDLPDGVGLIDLGEHRLADLARPEWVFQVTHPGLSASFPPLRSLGCHRHNLPIQLTSFVGRGNELAELAELIGSTRLLTVTGAGGCGKTRLALQFAAEVVDHYPGGVWWLELAPISDPALINSALAMMLGVRPLPGQTPLEAAVVHLGAHRALVLLDNCEHVLEPCASTAGTLLRGCPELTVVATSREPLGVGGEMTWRVPSLSLPVVAPMSVPAGREAEAAQPLERSDAVRLFVDRAVKVRPKFTATGETAAWVARICRELDGIPLAIELAAARVRVLSVERIAAGLADRFGLLTGGARGALPRLQTLRGSVEWSYALLVEPERVLLRRLGVFQGGFTLEACERVCAGETLACSEVLDLLTSLVDKSLVLVEERGSGCRYGLLETMRHYALERLAEAGEADRLRDRHAEAFVALAEGTQPSLATDAGWGELLGAEMANLNAAIDHTVASEPEKAVRLGTALAYWWVVTGQLVEGGAALGRALAATAGQGSALRCAALGWRAYLAFFAGDYELSERDATEALALARRLGDQALLARVHDVFGLLEFLPDPRAALPTLRRSAELARAAGDRWCLAEATQNVGWSLCMMGQYDDARENLEAAYELARRHGFRDLVAWHWFMLGTTVYFTGDLHTAGDLWQRCLQTASDVQHGLATWGLSLLEVHAGTPREALERLEACRPRMVSRGVGLALPIVDGGIALAHAAAGQLERAHGELTALAREQAALSAWSQALMLLDLAKVERLLGDHNAAAATAGRALKVAERLGNRTLVARAHCQLARVAAAGTDWAVAERWAHQALADQTERGDRLDIPDSLDALAEITAGLESYQEAGHLLGAANRVRTDFRLARWQPEEQRSLKLGQRLRETLTDTATARAEGEALSLDETISYIRRARGARKRPSGGWESLTPTELEIIRYAAQGLTNPEIGARMFISRGTVKVHLSHVYAKLGVRNRSEVTAELVRRHSSQHGER